MTADGLLTVTAGRCAWTSLPSAPARQLLRLIRT